MLSSRLSARVRPGNYMPISYISRSLSVIPPRFAFEHAGRKSTIVSDSHDFPGKLESDKHAWPYYCRLVNAYAFSDLVRLGDRR
jgi:hypothetical protein